ncbi:hypothetical protein WJX74_009936 [Apatococcus lobatus]|uniref:Uncharacterized protein n=1 Tax=Apatococcus lobatus TaxID=904363 RepID=A0AAW1QCY5_9CHLO
MSAGSMSGLWHLLAVALLAIPLLLTCAADGQLRAAKLHLQSLGCRPTDELSAAVSDILADATGAMVMVTATHRECGMRRSLAASTAAQTTSKMPAAAQLKLDNLSPEKQAEVWRHLSEATSGDKGPIPVDSDDDINVLIDKLINRPIQTPSLGGRRSLKAVRESSPQDRLALEISLADAQEAQPQVDIYQTGSYTGYPMEEMQAATVSDIHLPAGSLIPKTPLPSEAQQPQPSATGQSSPQPSATSFSLPQAWTSFLKIADEKLAAWANPASIAAGPEAAATKGQSIPEKVDHIRNVEPVLDTMNEWTYYGFEHSTLRPGVKKFIDHVKGMLGEKVSSRLQAAWDLPQKLLDSGISGQAQGPNRMPERPHDDSHVPEPVIELPKPHPGPPPAVLYVASEEVSKVAEPTSTTKADPFDIIAPSEARVSSDLSLMAGQRTIKSSTPMMTIFKASTLMDDSITSIEIEVPGLTPDQRDPRDPRQATNPLQPASAHFRLSQIAGPQSRPGMHWQPLDSEGPQDRDQKPQAEPYDGYWLESRPALGATARIDSDRAMPVAATYELQLVLGSITPTSKVAIESVMRSHVGSSLLQSILDSQGWRIQNVKLTLEEPAPYTPYVRPESSSVDDVMPVQEEPARLTRQQIIQRVCGTILALSALFSAFVAICLLARMCITSEEVTPGEEEAPLLTPTQQREHVLHLNFEDGCEKPGMSDSMPAGLCYKDGRSAFKQPPS